MTVTAVIVAAGNSSRMKGTDKIFSKIGGVPTLARTMLAFDRAQTVTDIVIVTRPDNFDKITEIVKNYNISKPVCTAAGGADRAHSVLAGVQKATGEIVSITDGARPMVLPADIDKTNLEAISCGAAALGVLMADTVKKVTQGLEIISTVDRSDLVRIQTPQAFYRNEYITLAKKALETDAEFTDDCSIYEYFGKKVKVVQGSNSNIKITEKQDLDICEKLCAMPVRVGHGYDVHRLVQGRDLVLCGETIDFELGLLGHSDADVALHALMDSMLGAAALGDIGTLFPDSSAEFKDISSMILLKRVWQRLESDFVFGNCDVTIIAQKPKLLPHIQKMRENIADVLGTDIVNVNVKATTEEKLGFTGSLEGISSHAVCTLFKKVK